MQEKEFISRLIQKLNAGNRKTIFLNALPGNYLTRLDLLDLDIFEENGSNEFLKILLSENFFEYTLSSSGNRNKSKRSEQVRKSLDGLFYEDMNTYSEQGIKSFGLGFPLLIVKDKNDLDKYIAAPLFIWKLELERNGNSWIIKRNDNQTVSFNRILYSHLKANGKQIRNELEYNDLFNIDETGINQYCSQFLYDLWDIESENFRKIEKSPDKKQIIDSLVNVQIKWCGVFGLYLSERQSICNDLEAMLEWDESIDLNEHKIYSFQKNNLSGVETDPCQEQIINSLTQRQVKVIQGPPGTGKSQTLTAIITNALVNGAKCLVVCEKKAALNIIYKNLEAIGIQKLCAVIDDLNKDREKVIEKARSVIDDEDLNIQNHKDKEFELNLQQHQNLIEKINQKHQVLLKSVFGDYGMKDLISSIIDNNDSNEWTKLTEKLPAENFKIDFNYFQEFFDKIKRCLTLYNKVNKEHSSLKILSPKVFDREFSNNLKKELEQDILKINTEGKEIIHRIDMNMREYGNSFLKMGSDSITGFNLNFFLNKQIRSILKSRRKLEDAFYKYANNCNSYALLTISLPIKDSKTDLSDIHKSLKNIVEKTQNILDSIGKIEDYYCFHHQYEELSINEKELFLLLLDIPASKRISAFEKWYFNGVLVHLEKNNTIPFENEELIRTFAESAKSLKSTLKNKIFFYWKIKQKKSIQSYNQEQGNIKTLYNQKKGSKAHLGHSLRKIAHADWELFTDLFPVLLMNPVSCSSILPMKKDFFEFVIFDEASQLRIEDTFPAFIRGKVKIISGDSQQMPPSNYFQEEILTNYQLVYDEPNEAIDQAESESLLDFGESIMNSSISYLNFHYRSRDPRLIEFSNAAFYGDKLVPIQANNHFIPIKFIQINGKYESGTNKLEAQRIVRYIFNDIKPDGNGRYPSIGIATMNIKQRNLIWDEINIYCLNNRASLSLLSQFQNLGFFVKNLENIQGDERDIIIISTTYGMAVDGVFRQSFGPLSTAKGYKLLNVIITRAKDQITIFTSIPKQFYSRYQNEIEENSNSGKGVFYAYLAYAEAISSQRNQIAQNLLNFISLKYNYKSSKKKVDNTINNFEELVADYLVDYIDADRIVRNIKLGGITIPLSIKSPTNGNGYLAIEIEGNSFHKTNEAYQYDIYRRKILEKSGFNIYYIWPYRWWKNPKKEAVNFFRELTSMDEQFMLSCYTQGKYNY